MPYKAFAAIDIGSHRLKMKIIEAAPDGRIKDLETVDHLVPLAGIPLMRESCPMSRLGRHARRYGDSEG